MLHSFRWLIFMAAIAVCLLIATTIEAVAPEIQDGGKFFSAAAVKKADERIREIYRKHGRDVLIETFGTVPTADAEQVERMDNEKRSAYFKQWAKARIQQRVVNGVYVMICKEPRYLYVEVHEETKSPKFAPNTWSVLEETIRTELKANRFDAVLEQSLRQVEAQLSKK